jgi:hypothetical protein
MKIGTGSSLGLASYISTRLTYISRESLFKIKGIDEKRVQVVTPDKYNLEITMEVGCIPRTVTPLLNH